MHLKITQKPSENFDKLKDRRIKYVIIHYTGMRDQKSAIKRLQSKVAKVSCHYLISRGGKVYQMVRDQDVAWHAGKSKWGKDNGNDFRIGSNSQIKRFQNNLIWDKLQCSFVTFKSNDYGMSSNSFTFDESFSGS